MIFYIAILSIVTVTCLITLKNFQKGFYLVCALRLLIPASIRIASVSVNTFLTIVLLISFFIHHKYKIHPISKKLQAIIGLFITSSLILTVFALNMSIIEQLKKMSSFFIVDMLLGILGWYAIQNKRDFRALFKVLCATFLLISIYGLFEYITKSNPYADWASQMFEYGKNHSTYFLTEQRGFLSGRIMGTTTHPLTWGLTMSTFFAFLFNNKYYWNKYYYVAFILIIINAFLCGSRSALIMIGVYVIIRISEKPKRIVKAFLITCFILICTLNILPKTEESQKFIDTIESSVFFWNENKSEEVGISGSSVSMRWEQLVFSFYLIQDSFLTGNGYGFSDVAQENTTTKYEEMMGFESILFTKIVNQGILGLIFFFIFYFSLLKYTCKQTRNRTEKYKIAALYFTYLTGIIFTGLQNSFYIFFLFARTEAKKYYLEKCNHQ